MCLKSCMCLAKLTWQAYTDLCSCMLQGDLSLMADKGHAGLPLGHVIAYKADHEMHIEFARQLKASCSSSDVVPTDKV